MKIIQNNIKKIQNNKIRFVFNDGNMGSGKTSQLLTKNYNLTRDNRISVLLLKPSIDDRYGKDVIKSRDGKSAPAISIGKSVNIVDLTNDQKRRPHIILVDEVQFLTPLHMDQLKELSENHNTFVDLYGLKNNFRGNLFGEETGSIKRLLELCNNVNYIESTCSCGRDATQIARYDPSTWEIQMEGPEILIGGNERYIGLCWKCWKSGSVPRRSRFNIFSNMFEDEKKKKKGANKNRLKELRDLIEIENEAILKEEICENQRIQIIAGENAKALIMQLNKKT